MFYVNNEEIKGLYIGDIPYNYIAYGFGKIIPEDRNAEQLNLNLAYRHLNQYRVGYGTVKDGYENALVSPRIDEPDFNGIFHSPFTYYYNGNIVLTKNIPVLITNGEYALRNALVYNDMNINGAINYFARNTDFQGHNVNVFPENEDYKEYQALLNYEMLNNCSNFDLSISTRFGKTIDPTLYNCNNFSGNFRYVGNQDIKYPGFRGFLHKCRDGIFNIDCTNMHGGGIFSIDDINLSDGNVRKYFNFTGIQSCENMNVNITGSSWQVWPHSYSYSSNCNINTYNVISGFSDIDYCNFNVVLPKDSKPEMSKGFDFLNNANNCNYNLNALDSNLFNYRSGVGNAAFFDNLNNCNLNLLVNNTVGFGYAFGNNFNNCNIIFDNIKADLSKYVGWHRLYNCSISGNVEASSSSQEFIGYSDDLNININAAKSSRILPMWRCNNVKGNLVAGDATLITYGNYLNLNVSNGNLQLDGITNSYFRVDNTAFNCSNITNTEINSTGGGVRITGLNNCYRSRIYANTLSGTIENVYNTRIELKDHNPYFGMWRVDKCEITGFPTSAAYTANCTFNASIPVALFRNSSYVTWNNVWPHTTPRGSFYYTNAGLRSVDNFSSCYLNSQNGSLVYGSEAFSNVNNMQCDIKEYYSGIVTAYLPIYNMNIKLNVDCNTLNLGIFQAGPPHGFRNATISADNIYAKGNMPGSYVQASCDTKIYCENYCNVCFRTSIDNINSVLQPVVLINNYQYSNDYAFGFSGGLTRIGRLNYQGGAPADLTLAGGACVFINNATLGNITVNQNSLLFLGGNVTRTKSINVESGSLVVNRSNWIGSGALGLISSKSFAWNIFDTGPWGNKSLFDYCLNV